MALLMPRNSDTRARYDLALSFSTFIDILSSEL
jgi:hypothetical protein